MASATAPLVGGALIGDPLGAVVMLGGSVAFGVTIAPVATTLFDRLSRSVPASRATEAFGWMGAAMGLGGVIGDGAGGWVLDRAGAPVVLGIACLLAVASAFIAPSGRTDRASGDGPMTLTPAEAIGSGAVDPA